MRKYQKYAMYIIALFLASCFVISYLTMEWKYFFIGIYPVIIALMIAFNGDMHDRGSHG